MVYAICLTLMAWQFSVELSATAAIVAIAVTLACLLLKRWQLRLSIELAYLVACALIPIFAPFLPIIVYLCVSERQWATRLSWLAALLFIARTHPYPFEFYVVLLLACTIASTLAIRTCRLISARNGMRAVRDSLREQAIGLANRNKELAEKLEHADKDANALSLAVAQEAQRAARFDDLSDRENTIVALIAQGLDNREIAGQLYLSEGTVRNNISSILQKKHLKNRTQIAVMYFCG